MYMYYMYVYILRQIVHDDGSQGIGIVLVCISIGFCVETLKATYY